MELSDEVADGDVRPETLGSLSERLEVHTRLEERRLFPVIEETLTDEVLKGVAVSQSYERGQAPGHGSRMRFCPPAPDQDRATARAGPVPNSPKERRTSEETGERTGAT